MIYIYINIYISERRESLDKVEKRKERKEKELLHFPEMENAEDDKYSRVNIFKAKQMLFHIKIYAQMYI